MKINIGNFPKKSGSRKVDIRIHEYDTWNLDSTLALVILPMLIQLKVSKHGVPSAFIDSVGGEDYVDQLSFDFYTETHNESFEIACKNWDVALDKMIWSFQQIALEDYDEKYHHGVSDYAWEETDRLFPDPITGVPGKTYKVINKNKDNTWYDHVGHQLHEERIQEGLELFGRFYRNLWD